MRRNSRIETVFRVDKGQRNGNSDEVLSRLDIEKVCEAQEGADEVLRIVGIEMVADCRRIMSRRERNRIQGSR